MAKKILFGTLEINGQRIGPNTRVLLDVTHICRSLDESAGVVHCVVKPGDTALIGDRGELQPTEYRHAIVTLRCPVIVQDGPEIRKPD